MRSMAALACLFALVAAPVAAAQSGPIPDPHHHARLGDSMLDDIAADVTIHALDGAPGPDRGKAAANPEGTMRAYMSADDGVERVLVEDLGSHEVFAVDGLPFPNRPVDNIVWAKGGLLVFDRWTNPHMGVHYVVDMASKKLVAADLLSD